LTRFGRSPGGLGGPVFFVKLMFFQKRGELGQAEVVEVGMTVDEGWGFGLASGPFELVEGALIVLHFDGFVADSPRLQIFECFV
jgi:hypothetical protein